MNSMPSVPIGLSQTVSIFYRRPLNFVLVVCIHERSSLIVF